MNVKSRIAIEKTIVSMIIEDAFAQGYKVAVDNGGDDEVPFIVDNYDEAMKEVMHTDEEVIRFHDGTRWVGAVYLVYGNDGWDAISDHTDNTITHRIIKRAEAYSLSELV